MASKKKAKKASFVGEIVFLWVGAVMEEGVREGLVIFRSGKASGCDTLLLVAFDAHAAGVECFDEGYQLIKGDSLLRFCLSSEGDVTSNFSVPALTRAVPREWRSGIVLDLPEKVLFELDDILGAELERLLPPPTVPKDGVLLRKTIT